MPTVIDSLLVTLGLDASQFEQGQKAAVTGLRQTEEATARTAREMSSRGAQAAEFFDQIKLSVLSLLGVLIGANGLEAILKSTTKSMADLGRQAAKISVSLGGLDAFGKAIQLGVGGNAYPAKLTDL